MNLAKVVSSTETCQRIRRQSTGLKIALATFQLQTSPQALGVLWKTNLWCPPPNLQSCWLHPASHGRRQCVAANVVRGHGREYDVF